MNQLQDFMAAGNLQSRAVIGEAFTVVGESPSVSRTGTFGNPTVIPIMTRQGYQDHLVTFMTCEKVLFTSPPAAKGSIVRTQTGRTMFVQVVDFTHPVIYTFTLTDREL